MFRIACTTLECLHSGHQISGKCPKSHVINPHELFVLSFVRNSVNKQHRLCIVFEADNRSFDSMINLSPCWRGENRKTRLPDKCLLQTCTQNNFIEMRKLTSKSIRAILTIAKITIENWCDAKWLERNMT